MQHSFILWDIEGRKCVGDEDRTLADRQEMIGRHIELEIQHTTEKGGKVIDIDRQVNWHKACR